jgi:hypothetical protein
MNRKCYYALSFTWGIIMTTIGFLVAGALRLAGKKPTKEGPCWCFVVGKNWGGVSLGPVMLMSPANYAAGRTVKHEFGHSLQNCIWGPLFPFVIALPSAGRWNKFRVLRKKGIKPTEEYDDAWFEGQATEWGNKYFDKF